MCVSDADEAAERVCLLTQIWPLGSVLKTELSLDPFSNSVWY